jgi:glyceraldehyde-3-phosphate dehydrogenase [NAD(P)+]
MTLRIPEEFNDIHEMRDNDVYFKNYIGGKWDFIGKDVRPVKNPYDGSTVAHIPYLSKEDVELAVDSAFRNRQKIRDVPAIERIELFKKAADLLKEYEDYLVRSLILEAGKPAHNAKGEVKATIRRMEMVAEEARKIFGEYIPGDWSEDTMQKFALAIREPIGVVLAISPFNYPLFITSAKVVPALLAGNSVVVKLPSTDPITFLLFSRILEEAGLPEGAMNVVTTSGKIIDEFVDDNRIGAVTFTGSTDVGKKIAGIAGMKHLHLELGGNGAALVLGDADLDLAASKVVHGSLNFSGQRCDAISLSLIHI